MITATFKHASADVMDLVLGDYPLSTPHSGLSVSDPSTTNTTSPSETIGVTGNHPFWSLDRAEFVQAGELAIGERLQTLSGDIRWVQQKLPRPGPEPVYNLEVHGEHVYYVGTDGVLAHNAYPQSILLGQNMARVNPIAAANGWRTLADVGWTWKKNRDFMYYAIRNARAGKARIFDVGMDPTKGYVGKYTKQEMQLLVRHGFKRKWIGHTIDPRTGGWIKLFEWVPK